MDLRVAAAYLALDLLRGRDVPAMAASVLSQGQKSEALTLLAAESHGLLRDHADLLTQALSDVGVVVPGKHEASMIIARYHAKCAVDGHISAYHAAKSIVCEAVHPLQHAPEELAVFVGLEAEYDDFSDSIGADY